MHVDGGHRHKPIDFQRRHFQNGCLAAILDFLVSGLWLYFGFEYQLQTSAAQYLCKWVGAYRFSGTSFSKGGLAAILDFSVFGLCRWHGFRSVSQVCFGISISNFICMFMVVIGRSLLIFRRSLSKWPRGGRIGFFGFLSNFSLALNINCKLQWQNTWLPGGHIRFFGFWMAWFWQSNSSLL